MNETTQQEKTTQLGSRNETTQLVSRHETTQLISRNETTQLNRRKQLNSSVGTKQLNSALPSTACNRLQPPTTAYNRLQPPAPPAPPLQQNRLFLPTDVPPAVSRLGEGGAAQVSSSILYCGSKLRGPSSRALV
ncbi:hypothetical protein TNCV_1409711 [Trichonephila clavipes]|uniref:Uncharacterized protein n=1 Tax=Trichonephila clavipes TaxID=2585209 RepID=A0A8X6UYQ3_TRICX|nr:hypothetical protein TNCV_1409711 [Trichonephila clavipes]